MRRPGLSMDGQIAVIAVAAKGSLEAAGKYLGVTKSAIRKRLQGVDSELGAAVFQPSHNGMVLTEAGGIFLAEARESVRHAQFGVDAVRAFLRAKNQDLRIGYSSHLNEKLLDIITKLEFGVSPSSQRCESLLTYQVVDGVLRGELHIGFGYLPLNESELSVRLLLEEPLMACLPTGHRLATKHVLALEDLANEPIIAIARQALPGRHEEIVRYFQTQGVGLTIAADAYLPKEALWLASKGAGIALMTRASASSRSDLVIRPFSDQLLTVKSGVFVRRGHKTKEIQDFLDLAWTATAVLRANTRQTRKRRI